MFAVSPGKAATLSYEGATLEIGPTAVSAKTNICITPLDQSSMSALDKGMTDVTQGQRKGYRFTPHGMRFSAKIKVRLPYDPTLIPATSSEQDLKTYFFDDQLGMWVELERVAVDTDRQDDHQPDRPFHRHDHRDGRGARSPREHVAQPDQHQGYEGRRSRARPST